MLDFPPSNMPDFEDPAFDIGTTQFILSFVVGPFQLFWICSQESLPSYVLSQRFWPSKPGQITALVPSIPKALGT